MPSHEIGVTGAPAEPPPNSRAQAPVYGVVGGGQDQELPSNNDHEGAIVRAGRLEAAQTAAAELPFATGYKIGGEVAGGTQQVDGRPPLDGGDDGTGSGRTPEDLAAVRGDAAVVLEEEGGGDDRRSGDETASTKSRPSELFDSLDLSAS